MTLIPINLVYEDVISGTILEKILCNVDAEYAVGLRLTRNGFGYIKKNIQGFNQAAQGSPYLVLTDLDQVDCPITLINNWLGGQAKHPIVSLQSVLSHIFGQLDWRDDS
ncbi:hypothetical protein AY600_14225 [Phormidium willei BDU 130791]|nr:hypothetical protein AY600_14225 [Phormidium willei BDU 130791]